MVDFWTYCSINCVHALSDMEYLRSKYADEHSVVIVGCHSAKFPNERSSERLRDAILRLDVRHPVLNDDRMITWRNYGRRSWPSLVLVSPTTQLPLLFLSGEGHRQTLDLFISVAYDFYYKRLDHTENFTTLPEPNVKSESLLLSANRKQTSPSESAACVNAQSQNLRYPGKVFCLEQQEGLKSNLLIISDSGNNRLIVVNEQTLECQDVIGNGKVGLVDGDFTEA